MVRISNTGVEPLLQRDAATSTSIDSSVTGAMPGSQACVTAASDLELEHRGMETHEQVVQTRDTSSSFSESDEEVIITCIRAMDVALGLRRLPAGFYAVVQYEDVAKWRSEIKSSSINHDFVEWNGPVILPLTLSANIRLEVYASFEFQPVLGVGELLQSLTITVGQLLDRGTKILPFSFFPEDGDVVSPCTSILATVECRRCEGSGSSSSTIPNSQRSVTEPLEDATNHGHSALSRYRRYGAKRDLEHSVEHFGKALCICSLNHPCRAAALSNLALAKFILCQVEDKDTSLPLTLYREALVTRCVGHMDRPPTLIRLAEVHLARWGKGRDEAEGALAERLLHEVMRLTSVGSYEKRAATFLLRLLAQSRTSRLDYSSSVERDSRHLNKDPQFLSHQLLQHFERSGNPADLEQGIAILKQLVRSTSASDTRYRVLLWNLGAALRRRFDCFRELRDLENAVSALKEVAEITPPGHPDRQNCLNNFGGALLTRFKSLGKLGDLEDGISILKDAVELTPSGHPLKPDCLNNLSASFLCRFQHFGELNDLEEGISITREAVSITPSSHPNLSGHLNNLGIFFRIRFEHLGGLGDIENAISIFKDANDLTLPGNPRKPECLCNLGISFMTRFECLGELSDLDNAISTLKDAADITPPGYPGKTGLRNKLSAAFFTRFNLLEELSDLEKVILILGDATNLVPACHPDNLRRLSILGTSFFTRFKRLGELSDLEDALLTFRNLADLTPPDHVDKLNCLNNLSSCLLSRYKRLGKLQDLENTFDMLRDFIGVTPPSRPEMPTTLNNFGIALLSRFYHCGDISDLEKAILMLRNATNITPLGHPHKLRHVTNLGTSFLDRFHHLGELNDLESAISMFRDATGFTPASYHERLGCLDKLGLSLKIRFQRLGDLSDLEDAISMHKDIVQRIPLSHPDKPHCLSNLGTAFFDRFERLGELGDLENAISILGDATDLTPPGHPDKPGRLNNLGTALFTRFYRLNEYSDLSIAISMLKHATSALPVSHPDRATCLNNLGLCLRNRFYCLGDIGDLENAISILRDSVDLTPSSHHDKLRLLSNLGSSLGIRFEHLRELSDLDYAISTLLGVASITPPGHPDRPTCLNNLGLFFLARFECLRRPDDIKNAISVLRDATDLTPPGHPDKPRNLSNLGNSFLARFECLGDLSDLENAVSLYSHAASTPFGSIQHRFRAAQNWISCAHRIHHQSLLCAYSVAIDLLPRLAWIGLSLSHRYHELARGANVVREAVAAALNAGSPEIAVEWLEQGRSIVWGGLFQLRSSFEELSSAHPGYARRLRELSIQLEHAGATREQSLSALVERPPHVSDHVPGSLQQEADNHRALAIERDKLVREVRKLPGFEGFLRKKKFAQLRAALHAGTVVMLNAAESRCDALIVLPNVDHVIHVPLPMFTLEQSARFRSTLKGFVRQTREGRSAQCEDITWESLLSPLWQCVVKPVLDASAFSVPGELSRIFWCPSGPFAFLPIHAAGIYDDQHSQPGHKVFDYVVSSYVPSLSILTLASNPVVPSSNDLRVLVVTQPSSDGQSRLPGVIAELEEIRAVVAKSPSTCIALAESDTGTVEEVLDLMKESDWVHFACHGIQDGVNSGLCLADRRRLKVRDLTGLTRSPGGLAFLSACQTAKGEERLSDEAIHIAAGMLFAGYSGVVGTMWSISDRLAPDVARHVYDYLFRGISKPDYREAARALHEAIGNARDTERVPFEEWIPFIHVGL